VDNRIEICFEQELDAEVTREGCMNEPTTVQDVIRLLFEADTYPRMSNHDWTVAARMEAEALQKVTTAVPCPDDPPEFTRWLQTLQRSGLTEYEREKVYDAIHDFFAGAGVSGPMTINQE
jgi:hypothetical protein